MTFFPARHILGTQKNVPALKTIDQEFKIEPIS
jgi:hypothetical protein